MTRSSIKREIKASSSTTSSRRPFKSLSRARTIAASSPSQGAIFCHEGPLASALHQIVTAVDRAGQAIGKTVANAATSPAFPAVPSDPLPAQQRADGHHVAHRRARDYPQVRRLPESVIDRCIAQPGSASALGADGPRSNLGTPTIPPAGRPWPSREHPTLAPRSVINGVSSK